MNDVVVEMNVDTAVYKTLLESTKAIPWKIDWETMSFAYIGPQIESLLGWSPHSWVGIDDWIERMHPDDRDRVVNFCVAQSKAGVDHEADYRALKADGTYVWIRDVVHVVRNGAGEVEALIGFMFDISERKQNEEKLLRLQRELEELSYQDGLTGVANRRLLDSVLETEWASARRSGQPLSFIMLDIDCFKQYNDHYGHLAGDDCLLRIAQILGSSIVRPRDLLARFGGEEFALVLPETDLESARQVAERCRAAISDAAIPHRASDVSHLVTVSMGVATANPAEGGGQASLIEKADRLLYRAKQGGRDRIVTE
ncbi:sensor domain-containing diguanylate cyclase [Halomonas sp. LR3S48]|uniref:sensor domain-containing diguanylate cyclase n=1 Tax=Halomonadaceae TaxID=28256 RepID=UPI0021E47021|nr:sensor domain-containing diguanylate cyclase [Halomonas sp. LR3S48]UYG05521.1 sensor domain-containing diguanylate cyclase [Halomonas sp. LR3S48]